MDYLDFIEFKITDLIDILFVAFLLYYVYKLLRDTVAINIFIGIVMVWAFWNLTKLLGMKMISSVNATSTRLVTLISALSGRSARLRAPPRLWRPSELI